MCVGGEVCRTILVQGRKGSNSHEVGSVGCVGTVKRGVWIRRLEVIGTENERSHRQDTGVELPNLYGTTGTLRDVTTRVPYKINREQYRLMDAVGVPGPGPPGPPDLGPCGTSHHEM